jgi:hypothetical protein
LIEPSDDSISCWVRGTEPDRRTSRRRTEGRSTQGGSSAKGSTGTAAQSGADEPGRDTRRHGTAGASVRPRFGCPKDDEASRSHCGDTNRRRPASRTRWRPRPDTPVYGTTRRVKYANVARSQSPILGSGKDRRTIQVSVQRRLTPTRSSPDRVKCFANDHAGTAYPNRQRSLGSAPRPFSDCDPTGGRSQGRAKRARPSVLEMIAKFGATRSRVRPGELCP